MRSACARLAILLLLTILPAWAQGGALGALEGRVQTPDKTAVAGATVRLETGQSALTDAGGAFHIPNVPAGRHTVRIEAPGYKPAGGAVTVEAGQTRSLLVETRLLGGGPASPSRPTSKPPEARKGTLTIHAYTKTYSGKRAWVSKIEVWEQGNRNKMWTQTWWSDTGETYRYLSCPGATVGKTYKIAIQWKSKSGSSRYGTWIKEMWSASQTESFYQP